MVTVKCPHCSTALKLREAPASGKVKCPKCSKIVPVQAAKQQPAPQRRAAPAGMAVDPDDDAFDFGRINFPSASGATAVSHFPVAAGVSVYEGPIPGDPLDAVPSEDEGDASPEGQPVAKSAAKKKKKNPMVLIGALGGVAVLLIGGIVAVALTTGGGGEAEVDVIAAAQSSAPEGYKAYGIEGVVVLMPAGSGWDSLPSVIESAAVMSDGSGSVYFLGAMNGGKLPLDKDQMRKKAERQLGGEILGGTEMERNGYKGIKGILDGSIFLPRMKVEVFHHEERFTILGCAPASMGADPSANVNRKLEGEEEEIFYKSFKIGPKPSGWFGW